MSTATAPGPVAGALDRVQVAAGALLRARYGRTRLGRGWAVVSPAILVVTLAVALDRLVEGDGHYALSLVLGLVAWNFFAASTLEGPGGLTARKGLLDAGGGAAAPLVGAVVLVEVLGLVVSLLAYVGCQAALGPPLTARALAGLVVPALELIAFSYGVALWVVVAQARSKDAGPAWKLALAIGFWLTPIVYGVDAVPEGLRPALLSNPVARIVVEWRGPLLGDGSPGLAFHAVTWLGVGLTLATGLTLARRAGPSLAERL